jgi:hypothetical protein
MRCTGGAGVIVYDSFGIDVGKRVVWLVAHRRDESLRSSTWCAGVAGATWSELPVPRLSNMRRRENAASRSMKHRGGLIPEELDVADPGRREDQIHRAVAE